MARPTKIDRLPKELRDVIGDLRSRGHSLDEILAHMQSLAGDAAPKRTALSEYISKWDTFAAGLNSARVTAEAIVAKVDREGNGDDTIARLNILGLQSAIMALQTDDDGKPAVLDAKEAKMLSEAVRNLVLARKTDEERLERVRKAARQQALEDAAAEVARAGRSAGISQGTLDEINRRLGVL